VQSNYSRPSSQNVRCSWKLLTPRSQAAAEQHHQTFWTKAPKFCQITGIRPDQIHKKGTFSAFNKTEILEQMINSYDFSMPDTSARV